MPGARGSEKGGLRTPAGPFDSQDFLDAMQSLAEQLRRIAQLAIQALSDLLQRLDALAISSELRESISPIVSAQRKEERSETFKVLRDFLVHYSAYEMQFSALRDKSRLPPAAEASSPAPGQERNENPEDLDITVLRAEVLAEIPSDVWLEATRGFGDPDLANT